MNEKIVEFNCPLCHCIGASSVEYRKDEPLEMPTLPQFTPGSYWVKAAFQVKMRVYQLDHWNRAIVCSNCGNAITYYETEE